MMEWLGGSKTSVMLAMDSNVEKQEGAEGLERDRSP